MKLTGPAIALLEMESIARGMTVADAVLKRAHVKIALAEPMTPGKYVLLFSGNVAEVEESFQAGKEQAGHTLLDALFLPQVAGPLAEGLQGQFETSGGSIGIVETQTVAATLKAADTALKRAEVGLLQLHLAKGIGGKGYFAVGGELHMVEAAVEAAAAAIDAPLLLNAELIQRPHPEMRGPVLP